MASQFSIPKFLLPQSGRLWRRVAAPNRLQSTGDLLVTVRRASSKTGPETTTGKEQQIVLEKPVRFNPPSHGARLPSGKHRPQQLHYGGDLSAEQIAAQKRKDYPGLPPPKDSWASWFVNSRAVHVCITMGTLASLAVYTTIENFKANSPFAEMLPTGTDFWQRPFTSLRTWHEVWQLNTMHNAAVANEKRKQFSDDVVKRSEYRKAHGIGQQGGFGNWTVRGSPQPSPEVGPAPEPGQKREKWLGIF